MDNQGVLAVISGFSGAGKGTLMRALLERYDNYALSATTRAPREGEVDGREYFFKTREEFEQMIEHDELVEYAQYVGNYYGTPKEYVFSNLKAGKDVLLEIEIQGALKIKKKFPEAVLIFVTPPSAGELRNRLAGRGTETPEKIAARLSRAAEESKQMDDYDFILVNDEVDRCVEEMHALIQAMHARTENHKTLIEKIKEENGISQKYLAKTVKTPKKLKKYADKKGYVIGESVKYKKRTLCIMKKANEESLLKSKIYELNNGKIKRIFQFN